MLKKLLAILTILACFAASLFPATALAAGGLTLYTPYTGIAVTPGESIDYSFDIINESNQVKQVTFDVEGLPKDWSYEITSGGWSLHQLSVKPNDLRNFSVNIEVPLKVQKGDYHYTIQARSTNGSIAELPVSIKVSEKGTFKTELTTEQPNMEGHAKSTFKYELSLKNRTAEKQHYALKTEAPRGWDVNFKVDGKSVTSVTAESNNSKDINVEVSPPQQVEAGTYTIPIQAATNSTSATTKLEAVITGTYDIKLSTPSGKLSENITAGEEKTMTLEVSNTGTVPLHDIQLKASTPTNWNVEFDPKKVNVIQPGKSESIQAKVTASDKAIAGDYVISMEATTPEVKSSADFRIKVETSMLWGWIGILIIAGVIAGIYYLMHKYGRR